MRLHERNVASIIVAALTIVSCQGPEHYVQKGRASYASGNFADAALNFRKALQKEPRSANALYGLGISELKLNHGAQAWQNLQQALQANPRHVEAAIALGDVALAAYTTSPERMTGPFETARSIAERLTTEHSGLAAGFRLKGQIALLARHPQEAVEAFRLAAARDAKDPVIAVGLVEALLMADNGPEAMQTARRWTDQYGGHESLTKALYRFYSSRGDLNSAETVLRDRLTKAPGESGTSAELARLLYRVGKPRDAELLLSSLISDPKRFPDGAVWAGDVYRELKKDDLALAAWRQGMQYGNRTGIACTLRATALLNSRGDSGAALRIVEDGLRQNAKEPRLRAARAELLLDRRGVPDIREAVKVSSELVTENKDALYLILNGRALLASGDQKGAIQQFSAAVQIAPGAPETRIALGTVLLSAGRAAEALTHAETALSADPGNTQALLLKSEALAKTGSIADARAELMRILANHPELRQAQIQLAELDLATGKPSLAADAFRRINQSSGGSDTRVLRGLILSEIQRGNPPGGLDLLVSHIDKLASDTHVGSLIVLAAERANRLNVGSTLLNRLVAAQPESAAVYVSVAELQRARRDLPAAKQAIAKARELNPAWPGIDAVTGSICEEMQDWTGALKAYRTALDKDPQNAMLRNNIAFLMAETGANADEAIRFLTPAQNKLPDHPVINDTLAWIYVKKGQPEMALKILQPLAKTQRENAGVHYHLGMAWLAQGDRAAARRELQYAIGLRTDERTAAQIRKALASIG